MCATHAKADNRICTASGHAKPDILAGAEIENGVRFTAFGFDDLVGVIDTATRVARTRRLLV